jgi:hypothetical protein
MDADHDLGNFTSFLRVCCSRYLSLAADGSLTRGEITPIAELNARELLNQESGMRQIRKKHFSSQTNKLRARH